MKSALRLAILGSMCAGTVAFPCFMHSPQPVHVSNDHIEVVITDQVAVKTYHCTFKNPNPTAVVGGECFMEVEPGVQVDNMSLLVDGVETKAELLDVGKANEVFTNIVRNGGSPALLEFYGKQLIRSTVPRVPANGSVTVKLQYTQVLEAKGGLVRLAMLNTNPKALMQPLEEASVRVKITSKTPIANVYSPTHEIKFTETTDADIMIEWSEKNYLPKKPFVLYYGLSEDAVGVNLLAHKPAHEPEGTFMLMMSPMVTGGAGALKSVEILPKDIVFCVDTSGSMLKDGKMDQAKAALRHCVENLNAGDRYNIVSFSTEARVLEAGKLLPADDKRGLKYADDLAARGGTAIEEALKLSLDLFDGSDRLKMIVFTTDGLPTIGESDADKLTKLVRDANAKNVRIFAFGEGHDVNTKLLDVLALDNRGDADYIMPEEDIKTRIAEFYDRVGSPVMTDLVLEAEGLDIVDVYPKQLPDLFKGGQIVVFGRYTTGGKKSISISGMVNGARQRFGYDFEFPAATDDNGFVPRLWAGKKVGYLLDNLRKNGESDELVTEVVRLAKQYGILTPYTSFLIADDGVADPAEPMRRLKGKLEAEHASGFGARGAPEDRAPMVEEAKELADNRDADGAYYSFDRAAEKAYKKQGGEGTVYNVVRYIDNRAFYNVNGIWTDSLYDSKNAEPGEQIKVGGDRYFALLAEDPSVAAFYAQINVTFKHKGKVYFVTK